MTLYLLCIKQVNKHRYKMVKLYTNENVFTNLNRNIFLYLTLELHWLTTMNDGGTRSHIILT